MADGLGFAETTPGPTILVTQHVGFLAGWRAPEPFSAPVAAALAAVVTTWATFAPSFLWIFAGAPHMERLRANRRLAAALSAITAVVVGVMSYLAVWFGLHLLFGETGWMPLGALRLPTVVLTSFDPHHWRDVSAWRDRPSRALIILRGCARYHASARAAPMRAK